MARSWRVSGGVICTHAVSEYGIYECSGVSSICREPCLKNLSSSTVKRNVWPQTSVASQKACNISHGVVVFHFLDLVMLLYYIPSMESVSWCFELLSDEKRAKAAIPWSGLALVGVRLVSLQDECIVLYSLTPLRSTPTPTPSVLVLSCRGKYYSVLASPVTLEPLLGPVSVHLIASDCSND